MTNGEAPTILAPTGDNNSGLENTNTGRDNHSANQTSDLQNNTGNLPSATGSELQNNTENLPTATGSELQNKNKTQKKTDKRQDRFNVQISPADGAEQMKKEDSEHDLYGVLLTVKLN